MLILTQEGIERIWEFYEDPYLTDEESETDSVLRLISTWTPQGLMSTPWGVHQGPHFSGKRGRLYPFEKDHFINSMIVRGWKDRQKLERILLGLYDVGYIDDVENVEARKDYPHGKIRSKEHTEYWYGKNWRSSSPDKEWTGRLSEVNREKSSPERMEYIRRLYPERFPD